MRKIFKHILTAALALSAVACTDDRNNFMVDDSFGFNNALNENVEELAIYTGSYELAVIKSGKGFTDATVFIEGSNADLLAYNEANGTEYFPLPKDLYSFSVNSLEYSAEEVTKNLTVSWDVAKAAEYMALEPMNDYVIPVSLNSEDLEVNDGRHLVILNLKKTNVKHEQKLLSWTLTYGDEAEPLKESKNISILMDRAPGMDLTLEFAADEALVAAYNEANGVNYALAPEGLISFDKSLSVANGELIKQFPVTIDSKAIMAEGSMPAFEGYVAPVRVQKTSVDGIEFSEALTYVVVKGMAPVPPQLFERVWGLYTTSSASVWDANLGLTDCRNITMDDNYIYLPQNAAGTPVLKAVSIADPSVVKDVNVTGIGRTGETHVLSCVRMLPTANGDVLMACNLTGGEDDFTFYIWHNGIDNAPAAYVVSPSGRRLGDKFIITGTWETGEVYCKDYNTSNVVRYALGNGDVGMWRGPVASYASGRYDYSAVATDSNCIGSAYVYPGTEGAGTGEISSFLITSTSNGYFLSNTGAWTGVDLGMKMTHGYSFFADGNNKYIAYISVDGDTLGGSVNVITDSIGTPAGFGTVLQQNNIVFTAPLQDAMDSAVDSPVAASHSTGDCVVREINGEVYMAAMIQHVGLSLFKMNAGFIAE